MAIFDLGSSFGSDSEEMAKARPINERLVGTYVDDLIGVRTDRAEFERVLSALKSDAELRTPDLVTIAQRYVGGGKKAMSRAAALAAISKRFVEIVRFHAKNRVAEKVRPW
jgi:hypothetical protein